MTPITIPADTLDVFLRLTAAAVMGAVVGFERDRNGRAAGLRTQLLVCVGTALFMIVSLVLAEVGGLPGDPGRVAAQVVTGIGFLGAGVILKQGITVRGLTTAACLWVTAAIGMAAGGGMYLVAAATCGLTVVTLVGLKAFETTFARDTYRRVTLVTGIDVDADLIQDVTRAAGLKIVAFDMDRDYRKATLTAHLSVHLYHRGTTEKVAQKLVEAYKTADIPVTRFIWRR